MKAIILAILLTAAGTALALESYPFGPNADEITAIQIASQPESYGVIQDDEKKLVLSESRIYHEYSYGGGGLTIKSLLPKDDNTLMVLMGDGSYSDGVWDFDLHEHTWTVNEWIFSPNFLKYCASNSSYYLGAQQGLYQSTDAETWIRLQDLGLVACTEFCYYGNHLAVLRDSFVYTSHDAGQTWQSTTSPFFETIRYTDNGVLYAIMARMSDSDGLWRSYDFGENWEVVFYSSDLACIGPNFGDYLPLGWAQRNLRSSTVFLLDSDDSLIELDHPDLYAATRQMDPFPLINTPSFYVLNDNGLYYLTNFMEIAVDDPVAPAMAQLNVYPNPNRGVLEITLGKCECSEMLKLYNAKGQFICKLPASPDPAGQLQWNLNQELGRELPTGIYYIQRVDAMGNTLAIKRVTMIK